MRHAPTSWSGRRYCGVSDPGLGALGRRLAARSAAELAPLLAADIRLVTSPRRRAIETMAALAHTLGRSQDTIEIDGRWAEADFGIAEGRTFEELAVLQPDLAERLAAGDTAIDWPGGETAAALTDRIASAWADLVADGRPAVVVTHAGPIREALAIATSARPGDVAIPAPGEVRWWSEPVPGV